MTKADIPTYSLLFPLILGTLIHGPIPSAMYLLFGFIFAKVVNAVNSNARVNLTATITTLIIIAVSSTHFFIDPHGF